jgi:hypothetical protein
MTLVQVCNSFPAPATADSQAALQRIQQRSESPLTKDVLARLFNDLDIYIFRGQLRRRVGLTWGTAEDFMSRHTWAVSKWGKYMQRNEITLRSDVDWSIGTLVHEMLHSYVDVCVGAAVGVEPGAPDPAHGPVWTEAAHRIEKATGYDLTGKKDPGCPVCINAMVAEAKQVGQSTASGSSSKSSKGLKGAVKGL